MPQSIFTFNHFSLYLLLHFDKQHIMQFVTLAASIKRAPSSVHSKIVSPLYLATKLVNSFEHIGTYGAGSSIVLLHSQVYFHLWEPRFIHLFIHLLTITDRKQKSKFRHLRHKGNMNKLPVCKDKIVKEEMSTCSSESIFP